MAVFFFETGRGACVRCGDDIDSVEAQLARDLGSMDAVTDGREATLADLRYVEGMSGRLPPEARRLLEEARGRAKHEPNL